MSSDLAIDAQQLGKVFQLYERPIDRLKQIFVRDGRRYYREFVALQDVGFQLEKGEVLGLVGRNGAGKSTLLQLICGTLTPTTGRVVVQGRIAALLELGAGFNPEFTGRENIYLNASVLGLSKAEIDARYDEIVQVSASLSTNLLKHIPAECMFALRFLSLPASIPISLLLMRLYQLEMGHLHVSHLIASCN